MNDDTRSLLQECESGCRMAVGSMDQVKDYASDARLEDVIEKYRKKHIRLEEECHELLAGGHGGDKSPGAAAKAFSYISTEMKLMLDNGTAKIADILADGCNMGIKSISGYENRYKEASAESLRIAERLVKAEEDFGRELRDFMM